MTLAFIATLYFGAVGLAMGEAARFVYKLGKGKA